MSESSAEQTFRQFQVNKLQIRHFFQINVNILFCLGGFFCLKMYFRYSSPVSAVVCLFISEKITPSSKNCVSFFSPQGDFYTTLKAQFAQKLEFETLPINNQICELSGTQTSEMKHCGIQVEARSLCSEIRKSRF